MPPKLDRLNDDDLKRLQMRGRRAAQHGADAAAILRARTETRKRGTDGEGDGNDDAKRIATDGSTGPMIIEVAEDAQETLSVWVKEEMTNVSGAVGSLRTDEPSATSERVAAVGEGDKAEDGALG